MTVAGKSQGFAALFLVACTVVTAFARWDLLPQVPFVLIEAGLFWFVAERLHVSSPGSSAKWPISISWAATTLGLLAVGLLLVTKLSGPWGEVSGVAHARLDKISLIVLVGSLVAVVIYVSTAIDAVWVRPFLGGDRGLGGGSGQGMPCLTGGSTDWKRVTRIWLAHRLVAWIAMIVGGVAILLFFISIWFSGLGDSSLAAVAAVATVLAGFYISRVAPAIAFVLNPPLLVGDVVTLADEATSSESDYYVMDVAMEGFKLHLLAREGTAASSVRSGSTSDALDAPPAVRREHDRILDLAEIGKLLRRRKLEKPCVDGPGGCMGINPYCTRVGSVAVPAGEATGDGVAEGEDRAQ